MSTVNRALIVDDEPDIRELLGITLERMGIECDAAADVRSAKALLSSRAYQICLTDMRLPDGDGLELVAFIQRQHPNLPVAVITAHGNMETAIQALKSGAFDFVSKPIELTILRNLVSSAVKLTDQRRKSTQQLIGDSAEMTTLREKITKLARSQAPVYISGESGTGKELVARMIHEHGPRSGHPFVPVNCGAIPPELIESELFGHKKGSFTGATADHTGLFMAADGGTLFLDEVAELPLSTQVKLLRAIQEKMVRAVGSSQELPVNCRILSATHKDLAQMVNHGSFRQDLYYRINVIELKVPPLRERDSDIPPLVEHFLRRLADRYASAAPTISKDALHALCGYSFPGNVRELENILERATALCENNEIRPLDLQLPDTEAAPERLGESTQDLQLMLDEVEKRRIVEALERNRWNRTAAARELGITLRALRYRIDKLGLDQA
ncbi:MAG: sigma-54-dependent Fis family transcriptional regulator [Gammaproteobacteria bacterium]|nr:sigma-54-dependent Fis family transcriptional regulator [Gammaproteobacteria bacterium]